MGSVGDAEMGKGLGSDSLRSAEKTRSGPRPRRENHIESAWKMRGSFLKPSLNSPEGAGVGLVSVVFL